MIINGRVSRKFERDGEHLICQVPITFPQAALGATIEVPTLGDPESMKVPAGTQSHTIFRIRGHGLPRLQGRGTGDLVVQIIVDVPKKLTREQRRLLVELGNQTTAHKGAPDLLERIKQFRRSFGG